MAVSSSESTSSYSDVVHLQKETIPDTEIEILPDDLHSSSTGRRRTGSGAGSLKSASHVKENSVQIRNMYEIDKSKPETYLNHDDLEKVTESKIYEQKRLFRWFHSRKVPPIPETLEERPVYPFRRANVISQLFFIWILPIVSVGYKRTLQPNDLWRMDDKMSIETLYERFDSHMKEFIEKARLEYRKEHPEATDQEVLKNAKLPKAALLKCLFYTFRYQYVTAFIFVLISNAASALTPLLTKKLIAFVEKKSRFHDTKINSGVGYAIGSVLLMMINGIAFNHFFHLSALTGAEAKSLLIKTILHKSMKLSAYSKHKFSNGKITSLMSTDVSRLELAITFHPFLYAFPMVFVIALVLLLINIGVICLVGFAIFFAITFINFGAFKKILQFRLAATSITDKRVAMMREILNSIKMIKFYAWEDAYEENVKKVRAIESRLVKMMQLVRNTLVSLTMAFPNLASMVTFLAMYKVNKGGRSPANIFSSLSLFQIMMIQMFFIPMSISTGIDAYVGLGRVQELLEAEEESDRYIENEEDLVLDDDTVFKVKNASFEWENFEFEEAKELAKEKGESMSFSDRSVDTEKEDPGAEKTRFNGFHDLNFEIKENEFIIITGAIGTGKSSLLNAMAGFMSRTSGSMAVNGDLLLCGYPWVQNATVRDNITFGSPFDQEKYEKVLEICSLEADLDILPAGDNTEVGERGITLSGGQKARITLARAVYKDMDIYLFDDVLSAVDSRVCQHIVEHCMMGYLKDKTRILATHQLSLIGQASRVIFLGTDGSFDIGTVEELLSRNKGFHKLMQFQNSKPVDGDEHSTNDENVFSEEDEESILKKQKSLTVGKKEEDGRIIEKEERAVNALSFKVYKEYVSSGLGKYALMMIPIFLFIVASATFCNLFSSVWLSFWTENKFKHRTTGFYMGLYVMFVLLGIIFMWIEFVSVGTMAVNASKWLNLKALHRLLHAPMGFMDVTPIGRVLNRFTKDTDALDNEISESLRLFIYQTANLTGIIILCIIYMPWFAIAMPFMIFAYVFIADHYQASGREIKRMDAIQRSFVFNNFNEVLGGIDTIKAYRSQERFLMKSDFLINKMNEAGYLVASIQRWVSITLDLLAVVFALIIALLCVTRQFHISPGSVGVLLTYVLQLPGLLNGLLRSQTQTENDLNSAERLVNYAYDLPMEAQYRKLETQPNESWPSEGRIKFEHVSLSYRPELPLVLKDVSIDIKGSEKIGICGRTGAGKSTIMSALYRLTELRSGKITIDDIDISTLGLYDLRKKLAIIPQDPVLFKGDIRKNLDPFQECTDEQLWDALVRGGAIEKSELETVKPQKKDSHGLSGNMHKFHLDQSVEENGSNFSLGERQLLALTRALVRGSKILILDEATSSVDYETDAKIQSRIVEEFSRCTILCIAHRLKTILNYDRILVLDQGEVVEFDKPETLFNDHSTIFYQMCCGAGITAEDFSS